MSAENPGSVPGGALTAMMNTLAEATLTVEDDALFDEARGTGEDPLAAAEGVRTLLLKAVKDYRQRHLRVAAHEYRQRVRDIEAHWLDLPDQAGERRALLAAVFDRHPAMQSALLTVQHREFKELSDHDVESCLVQLAALGVLADAGEEGGEAGEEDGTGGSKSDG